LENPHPQYFKESDKTVDMFIHRPTESAVKAFFMDDIDRLLLTYAPGEPRMKPDVLLQIKQIELEREKMQQQQQSQQQILMEVSGQPSVALTMPQIVDFIKKLQVENGRLMERVKEVETMSTTMQIQLLEKMQQITKLQSDLKPYREKEIKENVRIATELRDSKGSNLSEPMIESKIEPDIEHNVANLSDSPLNSIKPNLSDSPLNSIKPNLSDSPLNSIKPNLSQTWVVVEKSKFEPEIVVDCSENK